MCALIHGEEDSVDARSTYSCLSHTTAHLHAACSLPAAPPFPSSCCCQIEEAEIENLIQKEQKQVERLEWLLETVQKDYAYFNYLQQRFEEESRGGGQQQQQQSRW
jgi:membrane-anchored protein YejM (alkaline phosphatase superfamily)